MHGARTCNFIGSYTLSVTRARTKVILYLVFLHGGGGVVPDQLHQPLDTHRSWSVRPSSRWKAFAHWPGLYVAAPFDLGGNLPGNLESTDVNKGAHRWSGV